VVRERTHELAKPGLPDRTRLSIIDAEAHRQRKPVKQIVNEALRRGLSPDVQIFAHAMELNAEVHSNDSDFARFEGLRWVNPLAAG